MKRMLIATVVGISGLIAGGAGPATQPAIDLQHENVLLKQIIGDKVEENRDLQRQVKAQDQEIRELKRKLADRSLAIRPDPEWSVPLNPYRGSSAPSTPDAPPGSQKREFNGVTYYVVPLSLNCAPQISLQVPAKPLLDSTREIYTSYSPNTFWVYPRRTAPAEIVPKELLNPSK
jgi:hypothetical protein